MSGITGKIFEKSFQTSIDTKKSVWYNGYEVLKEKIISHKKIKWALLSFSKLSHCK